MKMWSPRRYFWNLIQDSFYDFAVKLKILRIFYSLILTAVINIFNIQAFKNLPENAEDDINKRLDDIF